MVECRRGARFGDAVAARLPVTARRASRGVLSLVVWSVVYAKISHCKMYFTQSSYCKRCISIRDSLFTNIIAKSHAKLVGFQSRRQTCGNPRRVLTAFPIFYTAKQDGDASHMCETEFWEEPEFHTCTAFLSSVEGAACMEFEATQS